MLVHEPAPKIVGKISTPKDFKEWVDECSSHKLKEVSVRQVSQLLEVVEQMCRMNYWSFELVPSALVQDSSCALSWRLVN